MPQIQSKYIPLYNSKKRYFVLTGGRGSGKTFVVQDLLIRLLEEVGQGVLYTRFTMTSVEKTIIPLFSKHIELISDISNYNITKTFIENKRTGSFIMFSGIKTSSGDQTANLKTLPNITTWVIEEGEDYNNESSFTDIDDSIRGDLLQNRVIWIQNPTTREHFIYKKFFEGNFEHRKIDGVKYQHCTHEKVEHIHTTYLDNLDNLDSEKVKEWRSTKLTDPKKYANKYIGAWLDKAEGVVFPSWSIGEFDESLPSIYGMDFGYVNDATTLIKVAQTHDKIYAKGLLYKLGMSTNDIINFLKHTVNRNDLIVADCAEPRLIEEIRVAGFNIVRCMKGKDSIKNGLAKMYVKEIISVKEDIDLHKELNNYSWSDKRSNTPIDNYNHYIDALRYAHEDLIKGSQFYIS